MDKYLCSFKIEFYDDDEHKMREAAGFIYASTIKEVVDELCSYYGEKNINDMHLEWGNEYSGPFMHFEQENIKSFDIIKSLIED